MTVTFFLLGIFLTVVVVSQTTLKTLEKQAQITVFFKDDFTQEQILALHVSLQSDKRIENIKYISKEDAFRVFTEMNKNEPMLLESISSNILPASLEIKAKNLGDLNTLSNELSQVAGVEEVKYFKEVIEKFRLISNVIYFVGLGIILLFTAISYAVIMATIRMTISAKKGEIEIQRLVGADFSYVRDPLIFQGTFFGLASSTLSGFVLFVFSCILFFGFKFTQDAPLFYFFGFGVNVLVYSIVLFIVLVLSGWGLGYFGSYISVKRYLRY